MCYLGQSFSSNQPVSQLAGRRGARLHTLCLALFFMYPTQPNVCWMRHAITHVHVHRGRCLLGCDNALESGIWNRHTHVTARGGVVVVM